MHSLHGPRGFQSGAPPFLYAPIFFLFEFEVKYPPHAKIFFSGKKWRHWERINLMEDDGDFVI